MKKIVAAFTIFIGLYACQSQQMSTNKPVKKKQVWVFLMAGQSNMAGRGIVEAQDTIPDARILTINKDFQIITAKEPLHFYEPKLKGLDCGLSFANTLLKEVNKDITILMIPTAVGGSSTRQWLGDSVYRNVQLLTNFRQKMEFARTQGIVKGILWHQGESDANTRSIPLYKDNLKKLFGIFREYAANDKLPVLMGELGSFSKTPAEWNTINEIIRQYAVSDPNAYLIQTSDLKHKGDFIHFDSEGQRQMGKRFAEAYLKSIK